MITCLVLIIITTILTIWATDGFSISFNIVIDIIAILFLFFAIIFIKVTSDKFIPYEQNKIYSIKDINSQKFCYGIGKDKYYFLENTSFGHKINSIPINKTYMKYSDEPYLEIHKSSLGSRFFDKDFKFLHVSNYIYIIHIPKDSIEEKTNLSI